MGKRTILLLNTIHSLYLKAMVEFRLCRNFERRHWFHYIIILRLPFVAIILTPSAELVLSTDTA